MYLLLITTVPEYVPGIMGGLVWWGVGGMSFNTYRCTVEVPDADEYAARVKEGGGQVVMEKTLIPGVGWFVACVDTEGNYFNLLQPRM
jgi:predicted enzyme related to lactoylglutathione lyase